MVQVLKEEIQESIEAAALEVFALRGFQGATMNEIARTAEVSTGNIYRYFKNKEALYDALIAPDFVRRFSGLLQKRIASLAGVKDMHSLTPDAPFHLASEELLEFSLNNRLRVVILLAKSTGTKHADFFEKTVQMLNELAIEHFRALDPEQLPSPMARFSLDRIYRSYVAAWVEILASFKEEQEIRQAVEAYSRYHLAGLKALFA